MDNYGQIGKIGSRFFITRTYPYRETTEKYVVIGKVVEGIDVLSKITKQDIILDMRIEE